MEVRDGVKKEKYWVKKMQFNTNHLVESRYEIVKNIHDGTMSEVYVVRDTHLPDTERVLKVLQLQKFVTPHDLKEALQKFEQEMRLLSQLNHPKITRIHDYFSTQDTIGNAVQCMVLDYINGTDLDKYSQQFKPGLSEDETRKYGTEILEAINYLHTQNPPIIFRDMKPANVIRTLDDHLVLIDLGIAKVFQGKQQGTRIGTEEFAAPEQFKGEATPLSDIYGVGTTMYALLTKKGQPNIIDLITGKEKIPELLRTARPDISPSLIDIIETATKIEPNGRYQNAKDMIQALRNKTQIITHSTQTTHAQPTSNNAIYKNMIFELTAYRKLGQTAKELMAFDESLERLTTAGWKRHPLPAEAFSLIIDGIEGKLSGQLQQTYENMMENYGEWFDISWERKGNTLIVCTHPRGLIWDGSKYIKKGFTRVEQKEFDITKIESEKWTPLKDFGQDFITFHYSKPFKQLPKQIQQHVKIYLPPEGTIWPAGRGGGNGRFGIDSYGGDRASRGVRAQKKMV